MRAHKEADLPALSNEIARLSKENADLRNQLSASSQVIVNGLPYPKVKTLLRKNGVLDFLMKNRKELYEGSYFEDSDETHVLARLGLVTWKSGTWSFTNAGNVFLNNLEFEELDQSSAP